MRAFSSHTRRRSARAVFGRRAAVDRRVQHGPQLAQPTASAKPFLCQCVEGVVLKSGVRRERRECRAEQDAECGTVAAAGLGAEHALPLRGYRGGQVSELFGEVHGANFKRNSCAVRGLAA